MVCVWDAFCEIRCISLLERNDRKDSASAVFQAVGAPVRFHRPNRSPHGGVFGCYESHYNCVKEAFEAGHDNVLIFEDDITLNPGWDKVLHDCINFMYSTKEWDALFLGSSIFYPIARSPISNSIWRAKVFNAHAYVVSRKGMAIFLSHPLPLNNPSTVEHVDCKYMKIWDNTFAHRNSRAFNQNASITTDNIKHVWIPEEIADWFDGVHRHWVWNLYQDFLINLSMLLPLSVRPGMTGNSEIIKIEGKLHLIRPNRFTLFIGIIWAVFYTFVHPPFNDRLYLLKNLNRMIKDKKISETKNTAKTEMKRE